MLEFDTFALIYLNRPIYSFKILFYIHWPTKKLIIKLKIVVYVVTYKISGSYGHTFPSLTMFEFINQYHFFLLEQIFSISHTIWKIDLQSRLSALGLKRDHSHPGIYTIFTSVTAVSHHLALKVQSPVRGVHLRSREV